MFRTLTCPSSGWQIVFTQHLISSLSVISLCSLLSSGILYNRLQRATIRDDVWIQFVLLKMGMWMSKHVEDSSVTYILLMNKENCALKLVNEIILTVSNLLTVPSESTNIDRFFSSWYYISVRNTGSNIIGY